MTITNSLIEIADWLDKGVCQNFKFKVPPEEGMPVDSRYQYKEACPHAFPVFVPTKDKLPPDVGTNSPSVVVQIAGGADDVETEKREMTVNLALSCWNPGRHSRDIFYPHNLRPEEPEKYKSSCDGWMDAWNFADAILRELESAATICGMKLQGKVSYGPYKEKDTIIDCWPFWYAWIQFTVQSRFIRNNEVYNDLL